MQGISFTYSEKKRRFYKLMDLTGQRFGRWTVLMEFGKNKYRSVLWLCRCDCGSVRLNATNKLRSGESLSCGCLHDEYLESSRTKGGKSKGVTYRSWRGMLGRCTNPENNRFDSYGRRGIVVCERWMDFGTFESDMGKPPSPDSSIERIDNDGNYEPSNCRWATPKEQARNRRTTYWIEYDSEVKSLAEWCEDLRLPYKTTWKRLKIYGWDIDKAFSKNMRIN